jgi:hypothetical protein
LQYNPDIQEDPHELPSNEGDAKARTINGFDSPIDFKAEAVLELDITERDEPWDVPDLLLGTYY